MSKVCHKISSILSSFVRQSRKKSTSLLHFQFYSLNTFHPLSQGHSNGVRSACCWCKAQILPGAQ
ncbi:hypothetical protein V6Z11_A04G044200 [Gossypium hirsutum]